MSRRERIKMNREKVIEVGGKQEYNKGDAKKEYNNSKPSRLFLSHQRGRTLKKHEKQSKSVGLKLLKTKFYLMVLEERYY